MVTTATMQEKSTTTNRKFLDLEIEDGRFVGVLDGEKHDIEMLVRRGSGNIYITYHKDGQLVEFLQHDNRKWQDRGSEERIW